MPCHNDSGAVEVDWTKFTQYCHASD